MQQPSIGRIVLYRLSQEDADLIDRRRDHPGNKLVGNPVSPGDVFPASVVRTWDDDSVNLRVLLDGNDDLWAPSRHQGSEPGTWAWPTRTPAAPAPDPSDTEALARAAYTAYGEATGSRTWDGRPMPDWAELGETIQRAWSAAATTVLRRRHTVGG
ncbi:hypothetical protein [Streptomyces sp. DH37]|uniref:hypothetical protein n=1 Tax=Streptomyces sp. DH37 TaxID=3040122 RepID=UPI002441C233|nr:hypothetical protein [Streptomyces sp. DH37]MDG9703826.1 hypothetical protein [Streptomyces sp. DH37]